MAAAQGDRAAAALCGLCALGYALLATPQYTATAQILVDPRDKQVVRDDVNPSSIAADGGVTQVESQASVLQSNGVLLRAIAATRLESDPEFNGSGLLSALSRLVGLLFKAPDADAYAARLKAQTLQSLSKHVVVKRADKVLVLDLAVRARTAERAAELANAIADAYLADQADARAAAGRDASKALSSRLGDLRRACARRRTRSPTIAPATISSSRPASSSATRRSTRRPRSSRRRRTAPPR